MHIPIACAWYSQVCCYSFLKYSSDPNLTKPFSLCTENELLTAKTELLWRKSERKKQKRHYRISVPGDRRHSHITWSAIGQGGNLQETLHVHVDGVKNWVGIWRYRMRFQITNKTAKLSQNWQVCSLALSMLGDTHMSYINNHEVPLWWCTH